MLKQKLSGGLVEECPGITAIHVIFADSASSNRTVLVMANTVATAALIYLLLYVHFKRRQIASRRSWKNEL